MKRTRNCGLPQLLASIRRRRRRIKSPLKIIAFIFNNYPVPSFFFCNYVCLPVTMQSNITMRDILISLLLSSDSKRKPPLRIVTVRLCVIAWLIGLIACGVSMEKQRNETALSHVPQLFFYCWQNSYCFTQGDLRKWRINSYFLLAIGKDTSTAFMRWKIHPSWCSNFITHNRIFLLARQVHFMKFRCIQRIWNSLWVHLRFEIAMRPLRMQLIMR